MAIHFYQFKTAGLTLLPSLIALAAVAQPTIVSVSPTANQKAAVRTTPVTVRFSQNLVTGTESVRQPARLSHRNSELLRRKPNANIVDSGVQHKLFNRRHFDHHCKTRCGESSHI